MGEPGANSDIRPGEIPIVLPAKFNASLFFIGVIRTPWKNRAECPRRGDLVEGPICRIEIDPVWEDGLSDIGEHEHLQILYWMHLARRDLLQQSPKSDGNTLGTFALRSPVRPNPISSSIVRLLEVQSTTLLVRGLDCVDGTPLIDIKPEHCPHSP